MRYYGIIGKPLEHSLSPRFFSERFAAEKMNDCRYDKYLLHSVEELPQLLNSNPNLEGLNVTMPYKKSVLQYCDKLDHKVKLLGVANVLKIATNKGGKREIEAYNTDIIGIEKSLLPYLNRIERALILGTGGAAKSVRHILDKHQKEVLYVSRTPKYHSKAISYNEVTGELLSEIQLIVNTSPVGMYPNSNEMPNINYSLLNRHHILFDIVYNPIETKFLQKGKEKGCVTISGIEMFKWQAEATFDIFFKKNEY